MATFVERMKECEEMVRKWNTKDPTIQLGEDPEEAHGLMDAILVEIARKHGYDDVADIFERTEKWYA